MNAGVRIPRPGSREAAERFTDRVADYVRYRPGYPRALIDHLRDHEALAPLDIVADIGSGTGISSELFLDAGCEVHAVEPNAAMREAAERRLGERASFHSIAASAEATTLPDASIDLVAAGTAFHWFDRERARAEFARIQRRDGHVALFWNVRSLDSDFMHGYEALLRANCAEYAATNARERANETAMKAFFGAGFIEHAQFPNPQSLDFDALRGRLLSSSYSPPPGDPAHAPLIEGLRALFELRAREGRIAMLYDTHLYLGRLET